MKSFARAATSDYERVHISSVLPHIVAYGKILREYLVVLIRLLPVFLIKLLYVAPFCRAVFFTPAVIGFGIVIDHKHKYIYRCKYENTQKSVIAPSKSKRIQKRLFKLWKHNGKSATYCRRYKDRKPNGNKQSYNTEHYKNISVIFLHGISFCSFSREHL